MTSSSFFAVVLAGSFAFLACGGRAESIPDPAGSGSGSGSGSESGSAATGGNGGSKGGTKTGGGNGGGAGSSSGGSEGQCDGHPECDPGDTKLANQNCPAPTPGGGGNGGCYTRSSCGETIYCAPICDKKPTCPVGSALAPNCPPTSSCFSVTQCGSTITCMSSCEGVSPHCDAGDTAVATQSDCLQDDAVCYTRSACSITIWCTGPGK